MKYETSKPHHEITQNSKETQTLFTLNLIPTTNIKLKN
jgi:hypothetical protein